MVFFIKTLASSSKGNSSLIISPKAKILVDAGITCKRIREALMDENISISELDAILVTHAHSDHTKGLPVLLKHLDIPVYMSQGVYNVLSKKNTFEKICSSYKRFEVFPDKSFVVNDIEVHTNNFPHGGWLYSKKDDAGDHNCFKFVIRNNKEVYSLGYLTDLGYFPDELIDQYYNCDFYLFESNHDENLQKMASRPWGLIQRNLGDQGHLSNKQAANAFVKLIPSQKNERRTSKVLLAHLSKECNMHELAIEAFSESFAVNSIDGIDIHIAPHESPSSLFEVKKRPDQ